MSLIQLSISLFSITFLSATILPFSSEIAVYIALKNSNFGLALVLIATLGNSLGGITNYFIGKIGNEKWLSKFGYKPESYHKHQLLIQKYGGIVAFFSWIPIIGDPLVISLGLYRYPFFKLLILIIAGKLIRYLIIWYFIILQWI